MQLSLFKKDDKFYLQIPDELANSLSVSGELELFPLKDGFYLLTSGMSAHTSVSVSLPDGTKKQEKEGGSASCVTNFIFVISFSSRAQTPSRPSDNSF